MINLILVDFVAAAPPADANTVILGHYLDADAELPSLEGIVRVLKENNIEVDGKRLMVKISLILILTDRDFLTQGNSAELENFLQQSTTPVVILHHLNDVSFARTLTSSNATTNAGPDEKQISGYQVCGFDVR